ncbi:hypothetical protein [Demequina sp. NBRC 110053]|uniref:hypothetical protein n=1 Tax=Demequina sp. NBRC 110053 TaxID=1570342 RepID=UPI000A057DB6|nr:hypothetical protein [Demequina sp. NBRC 110053]
MAQPAPTYRSWQPGIIALRPLNFGDFLTVPFKAMRFNRTVVLGGPLLFTIITSVLTVAAGWVLFNDPRVGLMDAAPSFDGINTQTVILLVLAAVALFLADVLCSSVVAPGVARAVLGERVTLGAALTQMRRRLGSLIGLYLVAGLVYVALFAIALVPTFLGALFTDDGAAGAFVSFLLMTVLLIAAAVVVTLLQGVARAMIVLEGIGMGAAVKRVMRLIRGRFWWSILIVVVTGVLINIVASTLSSVGQIAMLVAVAIAPENVVVLAISFFLIFGLSFVIAMVATYAYMGAVYSLLYIDLRMRREGFDLDLARAAEARAAAQAGR